MLLLGVDAWGLECKAWLTQNNILNWFVSFLFLAVDKSKICALLNPDPMPYPEGATTPQKNAVDKDNFLCAFSRFWTGEFV